MACEFPPPGAPRLEEARAGPEIRCEIGWHRQRQRCRRLADPVRSGIEGTRGAWAAGAHAHEINVPSIELIALAKRCLPLGVVLTGYLIPSALIEPPRQPRGSRDGMLFPQAIQGDRAVVCEAR
jgi:hypothetical protein